MSNAYGFKCFNTGENCARKGDVRRMALVWLCKNWLKPCHTNSTDFSRFKWTEINCFRLHGWVGRCTKHNIRTCVYQEQKATKQEIKRQFEFIPSNREASEATAFTVAAAVHQQRKNRVYLWNKSELSEIHYTEQREKYTHDLMCIASPCRGFGFSFFHLSDVESSVTCLKFTGWTAKCVCFFFNCWGFYLQICVDLAEWEVERKRVMEEIGVKEEKRVRQWEIQREREK